MNDKINQNVIDSLIEAINAKDLIAMDKVFTEDVIIEWPQSGERILGSKNRKAIYSRFPSLPKVTPLRKTGNGNLWILEAELDYGDDVTYQCVFIFEINEGKIAKEIAYWAKPFPPPDWRAPWVEHIKMQNFIDDNHH